MKAAPQQACPTQVQSWPSSGPGTSLCGRPLSKGRLPAAQFCWRRLVGGLLLERDSLRDLVHFHWCHESCLWVRIRMCYRTPVHPTVSCLGFSEGSVISLCVWIRDWVRKENTNDDFSLSAVVLRPRKAYWPFTDTEAPWSCHSGLWSLMLIRVLLAFSAMKTTKTQWESALKSRKQVLGQGTCRHAGSFITPGITFYLKTTQRGQDPQRANGKRPWTSEGSTNELWRQSSW